MEGRADHGQRRGSGSGGAQHRLAQARQRRPGVFEHGELLWGDDPPRTAAKALQTHISSLRRPLGDGLVLTEGTGWTVAGIRSVEVEVGHPDARGRLQDDETGSLGPGGE